MIRAIIARHLRNRQILAPFGLRNKHCLDASFDTHYEELFNRKEIDSWEVRQAMNNLAGMDLIPEPKVIRAALSACRRLNDYALAIRWLEVCKDKCGKQYKTVWPYIVQEIQPTLDALGIETPDQLGYNQPELALMTVYEAEEEAASKKKRKTMNEQ